MCSGRLERVAQGAHCEAWGALCDVATWRRAGGRVCGSTCGTKPTSERTREMEPCTPLARIEPPTVP